MDGSGSLEVRWVQGFSGCSVKFVDEKTACYPCGNFIVLLNIETMKRKILPSPGSGIGAFTSSGHRRCLAFSDLKLNPSIFVYNYPDLELTSELKGTADLDYTTLTLCDSGPFLVCSSSEPDYTISVWDCKSGILLCSHPLMTEDIITITFNPINWCQFCSISSRFLTIWNVEQYGNCHLMRPSVVDLPATDGSIKNQLVEPESSQSNVFNGKIAYSGPQMPASAIAGLSGERADNFVPLERIKPKLYPTAVCWSAVSTLFVGCKEGFLLQVNPDTLLVSVLYKPYCEKSPTGKNESSLQEGLFQCLACQESILFTAGIDGILRIIQINENNLVEINSWALGEPPCSVCFSPDYETLLLTCSTGCVYGFKPQQNEFVKILDIFCGDFVAVTPSNTDENICVSIREGGELQLWSLDDGLCLGSVSLQTHVTSMASCYTAQYVVLGTENGDISFVELTTKQKPSLVHKDHLYHVPIEHLVFDHSGNFLITGASDSRMFLLNAKPSSGFEIIGWIEAPGAVLSLSTQYHKESKQIKLLALCSRQTEEKGESHTSEGSVFQLLTLFEQRLTESTDCVDVRGCLCKDVFHSSLYVLPHALCSSVLATNTIFGYCRQRKTLQRFHIPETGERPSGEEEAVLIPEKEVVGSVLNPALLELSPDQSWLACVGRDGILRICETSTMEWYVQLQCHSCWQGGVGSACFASDSQSLVTTGLRDASLVCTRLRLRRSNAANDSTLFCQLWKNALESIIFAENIVLKQMTDGEPQKQSNGSLFHTEEVHLKEKRNNEAEENYLTTPSSSTWLDRKFDMVLHEEAQQYVAIKKDLRKNIKSLREAIRALMEENEDLTDMEKLEQHEFNLDVEEQQRLKLEGEEEVNRVWKEIDMEILAKCYQREVLKKECWNAMEVKWKAIKAFYSGNEVRNFPIKEETEKELQMLRTVESMRQTEKIKKRQVSDKKEEEEDEMEEEEEDLTETPALTGSLSALCGGINPHLNSQFNLHTREQKTNQITLLKDVIYKVKSTFNKEFEKLCQQKEQEINRIKEKNSRICEIMSELDVSGSLWEPELSDNECPERTLTVKESEIEVEKYLTPEQKQKEKLKEEEEQKRLAATSNNMSYQAISVMMDGVLEAKRENILKKEVVQPEFLSKPEEEWTEEERKNSKEYEKKVMELREEQEKQRMTLETEMKKLQDSILEATKTFDEKLTELFKRKVKSETAIYQEELKIAHLVHSLQAEEEILNRETQLNHNLEVARAVKIQVGENLKKYKEILERLTEVYNNTVAEDKLLDKGFRKEFYNVPGHYVDLLYKLYKRRSRVQRMKIPTENIPFKEVLSDGLVMKAMKELDRPENMPEGLDPAVWKRFCLVRQTKVESEQQVKLKALALAEMQAFLQRRTEDDEKGQLKIENTLDELNRLAENKRKLRFDGMVQIMLRQGQVEVEAEDFIADFSDAQLINRNVVEDLNRTVRALGDQKIISMEERKDFRKGIRQQEWEYKKKRMQLEDLSNKARDIQTLRISQEVQEYLNETNQDSKLPKQLTVLEQTIALQNTTHQKRVEAHKKQIKHLQKQRAQTQEKNADLDSQLADMAISVAERRNACDSLGIGFNKESEAKKRYQEILLKKKLLKLAETQAHEIFLLRAKFEKQQMKNFPALSQLHFN